MRGETEKGKWKGITSALFPLYAIKILTYMEKKRKVIWEFMGITLLEPTKRAGKDPCKRCWAKDLCDHDDCGRKTFPLFEDKIIKMI